MADVRKVLGQSNPDGGVLTDLYTVPVATSTVLSSFVVCNRNCYAVKFRMAIAVAGAADDLKQYLYYELEIQAKDTFIATIGITLATTDVVRVYSSTGGISYNLFGLESS
jgi:hypothetical protein